jgi:hypothetical protein
MAAIALPRARGSLACAKGEEMGPVRQGDRAVGLEEVDGRAVPSAAGRIE